VGLLERFMSKSKRDGRRAREARAKELAGDLAAAVELYTEAGLPDDVARVLLLRADAEPAPERRLAFCALAARTAEDEDLREKARARKALLAFDTLRGRGGGYLVNEVLAVARELEGAGELDRAADAYALAGDAESEVRVLTAAGAIERLEARLHDSARQTRTERDLELSLRRIADLDRTAERRAALDVARAALSTRDDPRVADAARAIRARLARGPVVDLAIGGEARRCALGAEVTIGRGDASIVIASRAASRLHLRLSRAAAPSGGAVVEDLGTRNGTTLAGARLTGPIPVGEGIHLVIGGEVPCAVAPADGGCFSVEVAGSRYLAPLGDLEVGAWRVTCEIAGDASFVVLSTPEGGERPYLGSYQLAARVELCHGDELRAERGGPVRLAVPAPHARSFGDEDTFAPFAG
jgi:FHA domain